MRWQTSCSNGSLLQLQAAWFDLIWFDLFIILLQAVFMIKLIERSIRDGWTIWTPTRNARSLLFQDLHQNFLRSTRTQLCMEPLLSSIRTVSTAQTVVSLSLYRQSVMYGQSVLYASGSQYCSDWVSSLRKVSIVRAVSTVQMVIIIIINTLMPVQQNSFTYTSRRQYCT